MLKLNLLILYIDLEDFIDELSQGLFLPHSELPLVDYMIQKLFELQLLNHFAAIFNYVQQLVVELYVQLERLYLKLLHLLSANHFLIESECRYLDLEESLINVFTKQRLHLRRRRRAKQLTAVKKQILADLYFDG